MLDVLRGTMYAVWSGVGIVTIALMVYYTAITKDFYKSIFSSDKGREAK